MYKGKKWCFCAANKKLYVMLVGRKKEQSTLRKLIEKEDSQFCVVYGRRRVGKTYQQNNELLSSMPKITVFGCHLLTFPA